MPSIGSETLCHNNYGSRALKDKSFDPRKC